MPQTHHARFCCAIQPESALNLWSSLRYLPPPGRLNHEDANRRAAAQLSKENNGEGRAGRIGSDCGRAAPRKQGAAASRAVESALLWRDRHEDRRRRDLVLSEDANRAPGFGQVVGFRT